MMRIKCPHCNGKGVSELTSALNMVCGWCMGQGELDLEIVPTEPQTEQEYLQTCTAEQLADFLLAHMDCIGCPASCEKCHRYYGACKETILEWLKQPHTPKE